MTTTNKAKNRTIFFAIIAAVIAIIAVSFICAHFTLLGADALFINVFKFHNVALHGSFLLKNILSIVYLVGIFKYIIIPIIKKAAAKARVKNKYGRVYIETTATEI